MQALVAFLSRHPWIYVVLAFAVLIGAWATLITLAANHAPPPIELKNDLQR